MVSEYELRMENLRRKREELTARREAIERKIALREATAAEVSAVALQSQRQRWKSLRAAAVAAKARNDEFIRYLHETQRKMQEAHIRHTHRLSSAHAVLEQEKKRYLAKVEELYPAWQERMHALRIAKLKQLEEKKRQIEKRRFLARKTFDHENEVAELIRQTRHEIELNENLEKNEAYERDLVRQQATRQALHVDHTIREHASGARRHMEEQVRMMSDVKLLDEETKEQLFDAFSPRHTLSNLRQPRSPSLRVPEKHKIESPVPTEIPYTAPHSSVSGWDDMRKPTPHFFLPNTSQQHVATVHVTAGMVAQPSKAASVGISDTAIAGVSRASPAANTVHPLPIGTVSASSSYTQDQLNIPPPAQLSSQSAIPTPILNLYPVKDAQPLPTAAEQLQTKSTFETKVNTVSPLQPAAEANIVHIHAAIDAGPINQQASSVSLNENTSHQQQTEIAVPDKLETFKMTSAQVSRENADIQSNNGGSRIKSQSSPQASFDSSGMESPPHDDNLYKISTAERATKNSSHQEDSRVDAIQADEMERQRKSSDTSLSMPGVSSLQLNDASDIFKQSATPTPPLTLERFDYLSASQSFDALSDSAFSLDKPSSPADITTISTPDLTLNIINSYDSSKSSLPPSSMNDRLDLTRLTTVESMQPTAIETSQTMESPGATVPMTPTQLMEVDAMSSSMDSVMLSPGITPAANIDGVIPKLHDGRNQLPKAGVNADWGLEDSGILDAQPILPQPSEVRHPSALNSSEPKGNDDSVTIQHTGRWGLEETKTEVSTSISSKPLPADHSQSPANPPKTTMEITEDPSDASLSATAKLTMTDRVKVLAALIGRVEEGANDGDQFNTKGGSGATYESKRELIRMASGGRQAQIGFYGSDVCFELIVEIARDVGQAIFPAKAFEGIMNEQRLKKVHQNSKDKELDLWKLMSGHIRQLASLKALPATEIVNIFSNAFLDYDSSNQRSMRKLREFLGGLCGSSDVNSRKDAPATPSPQRTDYSASIPSPTASQSSAVSPGKETKDASLERSHSSVLLQRAFMQQPSPPKTKAYGISSSGFGKKQDTDVLKAMASSQGRLSQKVLRGGRIGDYSEFEEDDEVDLENLIGSKSQSRPAPTPAAASRPNNSRAAKEDNDFDVDF